MLTATLSIVVLTALVSIVNGVMIATGGKDLLREALENAGLGGLSDADLDLASQLAGYDSLDNYLSTFAMRGYLAIAGGAVLLLFGLLMRNAATWARVMVTISAVLAMVFSLVVVAGDSTPMMAGLALLTVLGGILAIIFTWLPANGRYAKARR
jgi:dolichyl-phosphate-mannose--protein O-mannosyl transferase